MVSGLEIMLQPKAVARFVVTMEHYWVSVAYFEDSCSGLGYLLWVEVVSLSFELVVRRPFASCPVEAPWKVFAFVGSRRHISATALECCHIWSLSSDLLPCLPFAFVDAQDVIVADLFSSRRTG